MLDTRPRGVTISRFCLHVNMIHNLPFPAYDICTARRRGLFALLSPRWRAVYGDAHSWRYLPRVYPHAAACRSLAGRDPAILTRAIMACHYCALCHARRWRMPGLAPSPRRHYIIIIMGAGAGVRTGGPTPLADFADVKDAACGTCATSRPLASAGGGKLPSLTSANICLTVWGLSSPGIRARGNLWRLGISSSRMAR